MIASLFPPVFHAVKQTPSKQAASKYRFGKFADCMLSTHDSRNETTNPPSFRRSLGFCFLPPPSKTDGSSPCSLADPPSAVASLIQQFDGKLAQVADDNAQLRVFCTHLEGLLAAATPAVAADGTGGKHGQGQAVLAGGVTARANAPLSNGTVANGAAVANGAGWCDCSVSAGVSAGSSSKQRPSPPFNLRRGEVKRGSALPGTCPQVC